MAGEPKCWNYDEKNKEDKANCINCHKWEIDKERCKDHDILAKGPDYKENRGDPV